jgi:hypothetical protein
MLALAGLAVAIFSVLTGMAAMPAGYTNRYLMGRTWLKTLRFITIAMFLILIFLMVGNLYVLQNLLFFFAIGVGLSGLINLGARAAR